MEMPITNAQECARGSNPYKRDKSDTEEIGSRSASGKAAIRELCVGISREKCNELIGMQYSSREDFEENYQKSLEQIATLNEGRKYRKVTYIDALGRERFAGFIKGKTSFRFV